LRDRIAALTPRQEFLIVIGMTFGAHFALFVVASAVHGFHASIEFTDARLLKLVLIELVLGTVLGYFLSLRGWRMSQFRLRVTVVSTVMGPVLWLASYLLYVLSYVFAIAIQGANSPLGRVSFHGHVSLPVILILCLVNPFFEEALTLGYVIPSLQSHGAAFAIGVSAGLRLIVHAYQGPMAVVSILPMGLLFALYYWRSRELWPLVLAHVMDDFVGLIRLL
jgi:membrane protease YdiL (CAAX protease family)